MGQTDTLCPVLKNLKAVANKFAIIGRQLQLINGFVEAGIRVDIGTKADPIFLQVVNQAVVGIVRRAIEGHMLQKMRQPTLLFVLQDRSHLVDQIHINTFLGFGILADIIGESIGQFTITDAFVKR